MYTPTNTELVIGMHENRLTRRLGERAVLIGAYLPFASPDLVEMSGYLGFDWVFIDTEHGVIGPETGVHLIRAASAVGLPTVVRVSSSSAFSVLAYLEAGADCILAPHIMSVARAEELVSSVRYWPIGARGAFSSSRAARYGITQDPRSYFEDTGRHALPMAMIEDEAALEQIGELVATPGLDHFFLGAGDLSMSMGLPGQAGHPDVVQGLRDAANVLRSNGKVIGAMAPSIQGVRDAVAMGCQMLAVSMGQFIVQGAREYLEEARSAAA